MVTQQAFIPALMRDATFKTIPGRTQELRGIGGITSQILMEPNRYEITATFELMPGNEDADLMSQLITAMQDGKLHLSAPGLVRDITPALEAPDEPTLALEPEEPRELLPLEGTW